MRDMATGKDSGLLVARSSPAFMHPTFQAFYAAGRLSQPFAVSQEVSQKTHHIIRNSRLEGLEYQAMQTTYG